MAFNLLSQITVEKLAPNTIPIVVVDSRDTLAKTFLLMVKNNIFCAPVFDPEQNKFIGLVDMVDIACLLVEIVKNPDQLNTDYISVLTKEEDFKDRPTSDVVDLSQRNKLYPVKVGSNALDAVKLLAQHHVQRIPILDDEGKIVNLLTQSAVIEYLSKHIDQLTPAIEKSLKELNFAKKQVISIDHNKPAIEAFRLMAQHRISGIAVLDSDGKLMANISARDLRTIQEDQHLFERLFYSVGEFVSHVRQANFRAIHPSISCTLEDPFKKVIMRIAAARIHRIFVIDEHRQLVSVISLHDVVAKVLELDQMADF